MKTNKIIIILIIDAIKLLATFLPLLVKLINVLIVTMMCVSFSLTGCLSSSNDSSDETQMTVMTSEEVSCADLDDGVFFSINRKVINDLEHDECRDNRSMIYPTLISSNIKINDVVSLTIDGEIICEVTISEAEILLGVALCYMNTDSRCPEKNWEIGFPDPVYWENRLKKLIHTYLGGDSSYVDYSYCDLSGFDLSNTDFSVSNLSYANLSGANLRNSDLSMTNLNNSRRIPLRLPIKTS